MKQHLPLGFWKLDEQILNLDKIDFSSLSYFKLESLLMSLENISIWVGIVQ